MSFCTLPIGTLPQAPCIEKSIRLVGLNCQHQECVFCVSGHKQDPIRKVWRRWQAYCLETQRSLSIRGREHSSSLVQAQVSLVTSWPMSMYSLCFINAKTYVLYPSFTIKDFWTPTYLAVFDPNTCKMRIAYLTHHNNPAWSTYQQSGSFEIRAMTFVQPPIHTIQGLSTWIQVYKY